MNQVVKPLEQQIVDQAETIRLLSLEIDQVRREALAAKERAEDWERACREQIAEVAELREAQKRLTAIYEERGRQMTAIRNVMDGGDPVGRVMVNGQKIAGVESVQIKAGLPSVGLTSIHYMGKSRFGRWPLGLNVEMDDHAARHGLAHWSCVTPHSSELWIRADGRYCEPKSGGDGYIAELREFDHSCPVDLFGVADLTVEESLNQFGEAFTLERDGKKEVIHPSRVSMKVHIDGPIV